ncbi:unnamed protein product [Linum trigynum]|uniref:Uncharacterized protein n=1 Tax=Linum trigynum TaxID=586398 RepID=A0AAV2DS52_9ROSI
MSPKLEKEEVARDPEMSPKSENALDPETSPKLEKESAESDEESLDAETFSESEESQDLYSDSGDEEREALEILIPDPREIDGNYPENKYGKKSSKCFDKYRKRDFKPKEDDPKYIFEDGVFVGEDVKLRVIHYRRKKWVTGCFYADCRPAHPGHGGIFHREHYRHILNMDEAIHSAVTFVINEYETVKGKRLELKEIRNVTMEQYACWMLYVTFSAYEPPDESTEQIYQTLVTNARLSIGHHKVFIFRRKIIGQDEYEDMLPPTNDAIDSRTRVRKELMHTLDEEDREEIAKFFELDIKPDQVK